MTWIEPALRVIARSGMDFTAGELAQAYERGGALTPHFLRNMDRGIDPPLAVFDDPERVGRAAWTARPSGPAPPRRPGARARLRQAGRGGRPRGRGRGGGRVPRGGDVPGLCAGRCRGLHPRGRRAPARGEPGWRAWRWTPARSAKGPRHGPRPHGVALRRRGRLPAAAPDRRCCSRSCWATSRTGSPRRSRGLLQGAPSTSDVGDAMAARMGPRRADVHGHGRGAGGEAARARDRRALCGRAGGAPGRRAA